MGLITVLMAKPILGGIFVIIAAVCAWMFITPMYEFILTSVPWMPVWGWMIIGVLGLIGLAKYGLHILF